MVLSTLLGYRVTWQAGVWQTMVTQTDTVIRRTLHEWWDAGSAYFSRDDKFTLGELAIILVQLNLPVLRSVHPQLPTSKSHGPQFLSSLPSLQSELKSQTRFLLMHLPSDIHLKKWVIAWKKMIRWFVLWALDDPVICTVSIRKMIRWFVLCRYQTPNREEKSREAREAMGRTDSMR